MRAQIAQIHEARRSRSTRARKREAKKRSISTMNRGDVNCSEWDGQEKARCERSDKKQEDVGDLMA